MEQVHRFGERLSGSVSVWKGGADGNGTVRVLVSSTEFGQGTNTVPAKSRPKPWICPMKMANRAGRIQISANSGPTVHRARPWSSEVSCVRRSGNQANVDCGWHDRRFRIRQKNFAQPAGAILLSTGNSGPLARYEGTGGRFWDDEKYRGEAMRLLPGRFILQSCSGPLDLQPQEWKIS